MYNKHSTFLKFTDHFYFQMIVKDLKLCLEDFKWIEPIMFNVLIYSEILLFGKSSFMHTLL